jgi:hypothetical protein
LFNPTPPRQTWAVERVRLELIPAFSDAFGQLLRVILTVLGANGVLDKFRRFALRTP